MRIVEALQIPQCHLVTGSRYTAPQGEMLTATPKVCEIGCLAKKCNLLCALGARRPSSAGMERDISITNLRRFGSEERRRASADDGICRRRAGQWYAAAALLAAALFIAVVWVIAGLLQSADGYSLHRFRPGWKRRPLRFCLVIDDGAVDNRALVMQIVGLMHALARHDAEIALLELPAGTGSTGRGSPARRDRPRKERRRWLRGVPDLQVLELPPTQHTYEASAPAVVSLRLHQFLAERSPAFDQVVFHSSAATAYYTLMARGQGVAHTDTLIWLLLSVPHVQRRRIVRGGTAGLWLGDLEEEHMARFAVHSADGLHASAAVLEMLSEAQYRTPLVVGLWPGRQRALRRTPPSPPSPPQPQQQQWQPPQRERLDDTTGQAQPETYETGETGAIDETADATSETAGGGCDVVSTAGWGGAERRGCDPARLVDPSPLVAWLDRAYASGLPRRSRRGVVGGSAAEVVMRANGSILVTVCVVHHERGALLQQALLSIRRQSLPAAVVQTVLVDDHSVSAASIRVLEQAGAR